MKQYWDHVLALILLVVAGLAVGCNGAGAQPPTAGNTAGPGSPPFSAAEQAALTIPKGTPVYVRLQQSLTSRTAQTGENFSAVLDEPLDIEGKTVAPSGTPLNGRVVAARESGRLHNAGYLRLTLVSITLNGKDVPIQTSSLFVQGGSYKKRNFAYIGGGAGGGALIGALVGGGKGALIGSAIGAAGGTTAAYATGKKEVGFAAERRLGFRLMQPLDVKPSNPQEAGSSAKPPKAG